MLDDLKSSKRIAGTKQVLKAIGRRSLKCVYIAADADEYLIDKLKSACQEAEIPVIEAESMTELGKACGIDVGSACAGIVKS
ncbi:MAG: Ribosome-associated protein L7Ae-like protein [Firmicutes bacterium ADurb.Bin182]|nr:MAG: Ribosome-associated protein L7Ae-like protein [Firmicutes bacterium ADurb.Bin182]